MVQVHSSNTALLPTNITQNVCKLCAGSFGGDLSIAMLGSQRPRRAPECHPWRRDPFDLGKKIVPYILLEHCVMVIVPQEYLNDLTCFGFSLAHSFAGTYM